jgi:hypothetical protein
MGQIQLPVAINHLLPRGEIFMKLLLSFALACALTLAMFSAAEAQTAQPKPPLTNASVIKLVRAGFKEKTVISIIDSSPTNFDLSPDRMIELKRNGVSEKIIVAMVNHQEDAFFTDDGWGADPLLDQSPANRKDEPKSNDSSTDIFGSRGSGRSETRSRGGNGSASGDVETTGSATVRIIRPPTEAGGALKLEKSTALTNDSIVELVEAGFSEGTIIRRIEHSSVDFDLSSAKLAELRKHRVSEKIIAAMRTAMGEDANVNKSGSDSNGAAKPD